MMLIFIAVGIVAALILGGEDAVLAGAVLGFLLGKVLQLSEQLERLTLRLTQTEQKLNVLSAAPTPVATPESSAVEDQQPIRGVACATAAVECVELRTKPQHIDVTSLVFPDETAKVADPTAETAQSPLSPPQQVQQDLLQPANLANDESDNLTNRAWAWAMQYLREGNPVVKIGMVVLFFGLAFLIRHLADQGWFPIEARLAAIGLTGLGLIGIGWRTRNSNFHSGLILQGGGLAVCYLTLFSAMKFAPILSSGQTFAGMLLITCAGVALAVRQQAQILALFATAGGFMVPVLTSDGSNNFVGLFSFYLLLNLGILTIAWFQSWRLLNWTGFVFTFGISLGWAVLQYSPADYAVIQAFMLGYFLLYLLVSLLFSLRQPPKLTGLVDGSLVFGLPLAAFALQAILMAAYDYGLAWSSAALALIYTATARLLWQRYRTTHQLYLESQIALAVLFATLVIPLALSGHWISVSWALEAAGLLWLGLRQQRVLSRVAAYLLYSLALIGFFLADWPQSGDMPLISGDFIDLLLLALPALVMAVLLEKYGKVSGQKMAILAFSTGWLLWLLALSMEVSAHIALVNQSGILVLALALSSALCWRLGTLGPVLKSAMLWLLPLTALVHLQLNMHTGELATQLQPLTLSKFAGILGFALVQYRWLYLERSTLSNRLRQFHHLGSGWLLAALALWQMVCWRELWLLSDLHYSYGLFALLAAPVLGWLWLSHRPHWPGIDEPQHYVRILPLPLLLMLAIWWAWVALMPVQPEQWYLPLFNAPDLLMLVAVCLFGLYLWLQQKKLTTSALQVLGLLGFGWLNVVLLRGLHWLLDIPYQLASLWQHPQVQMTLSISWTLVALVSMQQASRRQSRGLWLGGGLLLLAVVAKLFTVDLADQGSMARILSFVVVGALMLLIGYIAPIPAKKSQATPETQADETQGTETKTAATPASETH
jgi:uncharacterized membrane protein